MSRAGRLIVGDETVAVIVSFDNVPQPLHQGQGRTYISGEPGTSYAIKIANLGEQRVEAIVCVDNIDALNGKSFDDENRGIVIPADTAWCCSGMNINHQNYTPFTLPEDDGRFLHSPLIHIVLYREDMEGCDVPGSFAEELPLIGGTFDGTQTRATKFARRTLDVIQLSYITPKKLPVMGAVAF